MIRTHLFRPVLILTFLLAAGCNPDRPRARWRQAGQQLPHIEALRDSPGQWQMRTELYFGLGRQGEADIPEEAWRAFVTREITPRFPDGLTVLDGWGQWREENGTITREPSRLLILLHPPGPEADQAIESIRRRYRDQFRQDSVLRTDAVLKVSY